MYVKQPRDFALNLSQYCKNVFSQNGEDGILEHLLSLLDIDKGWCCEFGAWDGKYLSNTFNLIKNKGWKGVLIESDKSKFIDLERTQKEFPDQVVTLNETVHYLPGRGRCLDDILSSTPIPKVFDVLSIDVDGPDYHIWKSLERYRSRIVVIEHSGRCDYIIQRDGARHKKDKEGSTSFQPMKELGESKGYTLLADVGNLIFLDNKWFETRC